MAARRPRATLIPRKRKEIGAMHMVLLGHGQVFQVEHEQLEREARRERQVRELRRLAKASKPERPAAARGFIPRIAGALGLF